MHRLQHTQQAGAVGNTQKLPPRIGTQSEKAVRSTRLRGANGKDDFKEKSHATSLFTLQIVAKP